MSPGSRWMDFNYDAYGMGIQPDGSDWQRGFGFRDRDAAIGMGYSMPQIRILAERAVQQGRPVGKKMWDWIHTNAPAGPWDYAGHGGAEFGLADLNAALGRGDDLAKIKTYTDYARKHGIGVGPAAENWMFQEESRLQGEQLLAQQKLHDQQMADIQKAQNAENLRLQREAAAEAKRIQEEMMAKANAVKTSSPTGVGGAANIRGSRLSITQGGGRSGTRQFARPSTQYLNTLGIQGGGVGTGKSTITL